MTQIKIPATYMRGGTSKGVFFRAEDLPTDPALRDRLLLRIVGSPDPYGKQIDGMGGATSSTSKVVLVSKSGRPGCDVDYWFGAVAIDAPVIDWSGNCGNLLAAVGPFAIAQGLVGLPGSGRTEAVVRIWQGNTRKLIVAHVPVRDGAPVEEGDFRLDGVAFPGAEIKLEFIDPGSDEDGSAGGMFPTGNFQDTLDVAGVGPVRATLINAGNPVAFVAADALGLRGDELQGAVNGRKELLARCEAVRAAAAVRMGLAASAADATAQRPATPKLALVSEPAGYIASSGETVAAGDIDLNIRVLSMGLLHHAMPGTAAVAVAVAAKIPGTVVAAALGGRSGGESGTMLRLGHPSGKLTAGAESELRDGQWVVTKAVMSRSARRLMEGWVFVPGK